MKNCWISPSSNIIYLVLSALAIWRPANTVVCAFQLRLPFLAPRESAFYYPHTIIRARNYHRKDAVSLQLIPRTSSTNNGSNNHKKTIPSFSIAGTPIFEQQKSTGASSAEEEDKDYDAKLANLDRAIQAAEAERQRLLQAKEVKTKNVTEKETNKNTDNSLQWPGGWNDNESIQNEALVPIDEWKGGRTSWKKPPPSNFATRSQVTRSDAGTLVIDITPQGITSGVLLNGAFSIAWFSAIIPATLTALSGGLLGVALFTVPFWAAGGFIAKNAVVDPFVSSKVSIGQFAWSVESRYGGKKKAATISKQDGSTQDLRGARVECNLIVNDVPQFELCLYSSKGVTKLGLGLPEEELEKVATEINDFLESISDEDRSNAIQPWEMTGEQ